MLQPCSSLEKALVLLERIAESRGEKPFSEIARACGLPTATAHRLAATLARRQYIVRSSRGRYLAGARLHEITSAAPPHGALKAAAQKVLRGMTRGASLTFHLGVLEQDMVTYVLKAGPPSDVFTREDMQLEAYCTAVGKVLLAALPSDRLDAYLKTGPFVRLTSTTIVEPSRLRQELETVRTKGFAEDRGEMDPGLRCLAVPVIDAFGQTIAAISAATRQGWKAHGGKKSILLELRACSECIEVAAN